MHITHSPNTPHRPCHTVLITCWLSFHKMYNNSALPWTNLRLEACPPGLLSCWNASIVSRSLPLGQCFSLVCYHCRVVQKPSQYHCNTIGDSVGLSCLAHTRIRESNGCKISMGYQNIIVPILHSFLQYIIENCLWTVRHKSIWESEEAICPL